MSSCIQHNWQCSLFAGCFFFVSIMVGISSAMSWLIVCIRNCLTTIQPIDTHHQHLYSFIHTNGPFLKASKKVLGMFIVQWTPLMVYVIADISM
ncbi:16005_t:CDS:2 [Funneliformis mosseae]|uniref:16005_t:CDS:1 n=1 Tax=Funneliformis mosseae TaxID=27381 RepID=A0A9N8YSK1_FUNMO|nr:16005_t:CDS:2 [Funneliformis mosseae]